VNHIDQIKEQIKRKPYKLPKLVIDAEINSLDDIFTLTIDNFKLVDYEYHPAIKGELFTGLKK
jgi:thymidylate synthase